MFIYYLFFFIPVFFSLYKSNYKWSLNLSIVISTIYTLFIGLRDRVGGDWETYLEMIDNVEQSYSQILFKPEPLYYYLINFFKNYDGAIYYVNTVCAAIFIFSLVYFLNTLPRPFLGLSIAFPYLIMVVGGGFTRQSVAIGLSFMVINFIRKEKIILSVFFGVLALGFHISGIFVIIYYIPFVYKIIKNNPFYLASVLTLAGLFIIFLMNISFEYYYQIYLATQYSSKGFYVRSFLYCFYALIFLIYKKKFTNNDVESRILECISYFAFITLIIGFITPGNTAILDRFSLFLFPVLLIIGTNLPSLKIKQFPKQITILLIHLNSLFILITWLNFSPFARFWLPYRNILFNPISN